MNIQLPQILFQVLNFSILMGALSYLLYRPILNIFEKRAKRIEAGQKAAEENLASQKNLEAKTKKVVAEAKKEAAQILEEAKKQGQEAKKKATAAAKEEAVAYLEKQRGSWKTEKKQLVKDLKKDMVEAVVKATETVLGKVDKKAHTKLINQEIDNLAKKL